MSKRKSKVERNRKRGVQNIWKGQGEKMVAVVERMRGGRGRADVSKGRGEMEGCDGKDEEGMISYPL